MLSFIELFIRQFLLDVTGKIRIWDTTQAEHPLKVELQPLSGTIKDIAWTADSQRIAVGGEGREKFCHAFLWDTGASVGDLMGHDKTVNSVDFRPNRPFRLATGSEDRSANFYEGPPFKLKKMLKDAKNFMNCVRFAPDGSVLAAATQDGHIFLYDGPTGDLKCEAVSAKGQAHTGGIYAIAFSPDSKHILSASGDKTAKVFDSSSGNLVAEFICGKTVDDMVVGCLWQAPNTIIVTSLAGYLYYLEMEGDKLIVKKTVKGHNKPISSLTSFISGGKLFYATGSSDGKNGFWDATTGECWLAQESGHANNVMVQSLAVLGNNGNNVRIASVGTDDTLRFIDFNPESHEVTFCNADTCKLESQPTSVSAFPASSNFAVAVACMNHLVIARQSNKLAVIDAKPFGGNFKAVSVHCNGSELAVGMSNNRVRVFTVEGIDGGAVTLTEKTLDSATTTHTGPITSIAYSPDGRYLAASDQQRRVRLYDVENGYKLLIRDEWCHSNASVTDVAWSPDSKKIAASSVDTSITIYTVEPASARISTSQIRGAHPMAPVTGLTWPTADGLVSVGQDACLRVWTPK